MLVLLAFFLLPIVYCDFKLSDSKLLLPYYSVNPVNYTLHGSEGACYEWHSGTPEVAVVSPIVSSENGCSSAAVITAVWQSRHRAVATIYAKIINADHIVKCDVIVDDIHRIEIATTTQELYLHNTPVSLVVTAYDEYGNTFTSLEGVPFEWRIFEDKYEEFGDIQGVLRFITWRESEYTTPSTMALLESKGMQGYMQLISGLRTGSAVVSVALHESIYKSVLPSQVRLLVMANAQLSPALAYLVPNSLLTFTVHVIQQGDDQEVAMPSLQYHLQVNDTNLAVLSPLDGSTLKALNYGQTEVTLLDRNVEEALEKLDEVLNSKVDDSDLRLPKRRRPTSLIQIVEPAYLGFTLIQKSTNKKPDICQLASFLNSGSYGNQVASGSYMPIRRWIMESGKVYVINLDIYDRNNHRLYPSDNLRLSLYFPESHFERCFSHITIKTLGIGSFLIILLFTLYHLSIPPKIHIYNSDHIQIKRHIASHVCEYLFKNSTMNHSHEISDSNQSLWNDRSFSLSNPYSCKQFKLFYGHTVNLSKEEEQFPLAFSIAIHQSNKQVSRLLRLIYRPHNLYCIHVDSKSPQTFYDEVLNSAKCFGPNVIVVNRSESVNVQWGYFSILEVFLLCADKLLNNTDYMWKYILNLTGQELPLRTNWELVAALKAINGSNVVEGLGPRFNRNRWPNKKFEFPIVWNKGSFYMALKRELIQFYKTDSKSQKILDAIKAEKHLRKHPDELYFPTLNYNPQFGAPGACINNNNSSSPFIARYVIWGMKKCVSQYTRRSVCIIGKAHLSFIPSRMEFFVNKFQEDFQPIAYDCIEYYIMNKVIKEMQTKQLDPNFNVTFYSRLHCSSNHI